jgi:hypothetical protein
MWEASERARIDREAQARRINGGRNQRNGYAPAHLPAPLYEISDDDDDETHDDRSPRSSTLNGSSTYAGSSSQVMPRGTSTARDRIPPPPPLRRVVRSHSVDSSEDLQESIVQPRGSVDTSYATQTRTISRTRSLAASDRTSSWVAEMSGALPSVPESQARTETTRSRGNNVGGRSPHPPRQSPDARRGTVDTSYSAIISVSSSESSVSDDPAPPPRSSQPQALASSSSAEVWVDSDFQSSLRTQVRPTRLTASESLPAPRVTQTASNSPRRTTSSNAEFTPETWHSALSHTPSEAGNLVLAPESPRPSGSHSSRTAQLPSQPRTPERRRNVEVSSDTNPALTCQCRHPVCPCCHLPTKPGSSSGMGGFGFVEPPHIANLVYHQDADPRSPMRRGGSRVPMW